MKIRPFVSEDYAGVLAVLAAGKVEPPKEITELRGPCFVAELYGEIVGVIFALSGPSTKAYIDYLAVREDMRGTLVFPRLLDAIESELKRLGVKRYIFHIEKHNTKALDQLLKYRERYGITMLRDLFYFAREIHA